jgi:hypothetical protein
VIQEKPTILQCAYCSDPKLFDTDFTDCPKESSRPFVKATGQFWRRLPDRPKLVWPFGFEARRCGRQIIFFVDKENFATKWKAFTVEVLGLDYTEQPPIPPAPLFHETHSIDFTQTHTMGTDYYEEDAKIHRWKLFSACRIIHNETKLRVKLHWWPDHHYIFTVENFNFQSAASAAILKQALSFFYIGRGRPTEHFSNISEFSRALRIAILRLSKQNEIPLEEDVAALMCGDDSFNSRVLRRWLKKSGWVHFRWPELVQAVIDDDRRGYFRGREIEELSPLARAGLSRREKRT